MIGGRAFDAASAARDLLDPERLIIVVVGNAEAVSDERSDIAPVQVIRQEDRAARHGRAGCVATGVDLR